MLRSSWQYEVVTHAKWYRNRLRHLSCTHGNGRANLGHGCTSTMQGRSKAKCCWLLWTAIASTLMFTPCPLPLRPQQSANSGRHLRPMDCRAALSPTTALLLRVRSSSCSVMSTALNTSARHPTIQQAMGWQRAVQTVNTGLKKQGGGELDARLQRFLFQYRLTPQSTTGQSPFSLLMHRRPRSRFDLVFPDLSGKVAQKQAQAVDRRQATTPEFFCGDDVWAVNFTAKPKWMAGVLHERLGPFTFTIRLTDGRLWKRHTDHLRLRLPTDLTSHQQEKGEQYPAPSSHLAPDPSHLAPSSYPQPEGLDSTSPSSPEVAATSPSSPEVAAPGDLALRAPEPEVGSRPASSTPQLRRSARVTRVPVKMDS